MPDPTIVRRRRRVVGSINGIQHEFDVLVQMYDSLFDQFTRTETELKDCKQKIETLESMNNDHIARASQFLRSPETTNILVSERVSRIFDDIETWTTTVTIPYNFATKWPAAIHWLKERGIVKATTTSFDQCIRKAEPELMSVGIISIIVSTLFLNIIAGALPGQRRVLAQLRDGISQIQPPQTYQSARIWQVNMIRAWVQPDDYPALLDRGCNCTLKCITEFLKKLTDINTDFWQIRLADLFTDIIKPASQLATEMECSGNNYHWIRQNFGPAAGLNHLRNFDLIDFDTRMRVEPELLSALPESTRLGECIMVVFPGVLHVDEETKERTVVVKTRVLARVNDAIPLMLPKTEPVGEAPVV
ncbi:hypothetical protein N7454_011099 [Penicillium verhagenii]|nr:hypothetical protein N7454_011099 [Penicillium verhagenii]